MQQRILYFEKNFRCLQRCTLRTQKTINRCELEKSYVLRIYYLFEICLRKIITKNYPVKIQNCIHKTKKNILNRIQKLGKQICFHTDFG